MEALLRTYLPSGETLALLPSDLLPGQLDVGQIIARLSAPAHDLLPTIPLRLALHALRIAVAWRQVVQARGTEKDMGGLRGFVGYCVLGRAFLPPSSLPLASSRQGLPRILVFLRGDARVLGKLLLDLCPS